VTIDIVLFALVAAFLVHRLRSILGTRHGDERQRPNPFASSSKTKPEEEREAGYEFHTTEEESHQMPDPVKEKAQPLDTASILADGLIAKDDKLVAALTEIVAADASFDVYNFAEGAKYAFDVILDAYAEGDLETLERLLSQKLFEDFETAIRKREKEGLSIELAVKDIKSMQIIDARQAGTMVYITVDYEVDEKQILRDAKGKEVKGKSAAKKQKMHDVWTFARDIRSVDPAWMLIETRAG